jgi:hypothetical protein
MDIFVIEFDFPTAVNYEQFCHFDVMLSWLVDGTVVSKECLASIFRIEE